MLRGIVDRVMTGNLFDKVRASRGIIFDFDGVLVDSEKHWAMVENPYLKTHIPGWSDSDYGNLIGKSLPEVHKYLHDRWGFRLSDKRYFGDYERMAQQLYGTMAQPLSGVVELLELLAKRNMRCAIASSSKREWIMLALETHGLEDKFTPIVSAHDAEIINGKPSPDVYLRALELLGEYAENVVVIEDSASGVAAAKAAKLFCIGLRNGDNDNQDLSQADEEIYAYKELLACLR